MLPKFYSEIRVRSDFMHPNSTAHPVSAPAHCKKGGSHKILVFRIFFVGIPAQKIYDPIMLKIENFFLCEITKLMKRNLG